MVALFLTTLVLVGATLLVWSYIKSLDGKQ
jgi:hypothetical protein